MVNTAQKNIDHVKQSATNALKTTSKIVIQQKQHKQVLILIGNKITDVTHCEIILRPIHKKVNCLIKLPKERYISLEKRQQNIDELRLM